MKYKKKRYSIDSDLIDEKTRAYLLKRIKGQIEFYATPGSSSVNLNGGVKVDVRIVRCYGCGSFMVENSYENSDNVKHPLNGYKCSGCRDYVNQICPSNTINQDQRCTMDKHFREQRMQNNITLEDIFETKVEDIVEKPHVEMKFEDSLTLQIMPYGKTIFNVGKMFGFFK